MVRRRESQQRDASGDLFPDEPASPPPAPPPMEWAPLEPAPGASAESAIAVSTLTQTARAILEGAFSLIWVRGEVSGLKTHSNGHWYFSLRDKTAQVRCVVWARDQMAIPASPDEGM